ncbi:hypothetical protein BC829DRAFT_99195 [Chytridium lagenaria]|nr:hypothetical protein BC829DRAFT_99195 [Chytridium lagenaria]
MNGSSLKEAKKVYSAPLVRNRGKADSSRNGTSHVVKADAKQLSKTASNPRITVACHYPSNLPITTKWLEELKPNDLRFFCSNVTNLTNELTRVLQDDSDSASAWNEAYLNFFSDYAGASLLYLQSIYAPADDLIISLKSLVSLRNNSGAIENQRFSSKESRQMFFEAFRVCFQGIFTILSFFRAREAHLERLMQDFEKLGRRELYLQGIYNSAVRKRK